MKDLLNKLHKKLVTNWGKLAVFILALSSFLAVYDTFRSKGKLFICDISEALSVNILETCEKPIVEEASSSPITPDNTNVKQECNDCTQIGVSSGTTYIIKPDTEGMDKKP